MSKLFWILLASCRGGYRYLRAIFRFTAGLVARLGQAPGSDGDAVLKAGTAELESSGVARPVADGRFVARSERSLVSRMVAWLVSVARFEGRTETNTVMDLQTSPAADMAGEWNTDAKLVRNMEAAPGIPVASVLTASAPLTAEPEMAPPSAMVTFVDTTPVMEAVGDAGGPDPVSADLAAPARMDAGMGNGPLTAIFGTAGPPLPALSARMIAWATPQWVDASTLYIRQVYETQRDGDVLILH